MSEAKPVFESEVVLEDDYPVHAGYCYLADGKVIISDVFGTVATLKSDLFTFGYPRNVEIRRCDLMARQMF
jgi:hypothetical protein